MNSAHLRAQPPATEPVCEVDDGQRWYPRAGFALSVGASALFWAAFVAAIVLFR